MRRVRRGGRSYLFTALLVISQGSICMSATARDKVLFSPVAGTVLNAGTPIPGARVTRTCEWTDQSFEDTTTTDSSGAFSFGARTVKSTL